jgi:hypothetical protein
MKHSAQCSECSGCGSCEEFKERFEYEDDICPACGAEVDFEYDEHCLECGEALK